MMIPRVGILQEKVFCQEMFGYFPVEERLKSNVFHLYFFSIFKKVWPRKSGFWILLDFCLY